MSWLSRAIGQTVLVVTSCCVWAGCLNYDDPEPEPPPPASLWIGTIQYPSGNIGVPLTAEVGPDPAQAFPLGIRVLEFVGPRARAGTGREIPVQVRSAGIVVHYPGGALGRLGQVLSGLAGAGNVQPLLYISDWPGNNVLEFDPATRRGTATIPTGRGPAGIVMSPGGERLYVALQDGGAIAVIDREAGERVDTIPITGSEPFGLGITPDGERLLACDINGGGQVHIVDIETKMVLQTLPTASCPSRSPSTPKAPWPM